MGVNDAAIRFRTSKKLQDAVISFYLKGNTFDKCHKKFGITRNTIIKILKSRGIKQRTRAEFYGVTKEVEKEIVELYTKKGHSINFIVGKLKLGVWSIKTALQRNNVVLKNYKQFWRRRFILNDSELIYGCNENFFETIDTEAKAYFLGLLVADGNISNNRIVLKLQEGDRAIIEEFGRRINFVGNLFFVKALKPEHSNQISLVTFSKKMTTDLAKLGVIPNKWDKTYFPNIPKKLYHHFIRGVFDGDGSIFSYKGYYIFNIAGNKTLISQIQEILIKKCSLNKNKLGDHKQPGGTVLVIYGGNVQVKRIRDWLYKDATIYLERKHEKFFSIITKEPRFCEICGKKHKAYGLCANHYIQYRNKLNKK